MLVPLLSLMLCVVPAGGRFKKEIVVDGQSNLLLIRDEGGPPEAQVGITAVLTCTGLPVNRCSPRVKLHFNGHSLLITLFNPELVLFK